MSAFRMKSHRSTHIISVRFSSNSQTPKESCKKDEQISSLNIFNHVKSENRQEDARLWRYRVVHRFRL